MPQLAGAKKELLRYDRGDGVKLTATLYTPPGYDPARDGRLPVLIWAYPEEFLSADAAGQVTTSPHRFIRANMGGALPYLLRGYAVLDDPSIPIIRANGAQPNDTYVEQLVAGAKAAVDEVVRRGVADPERFAVAGHSYGAFMTANLLAHTDLFRAGIARSGAYNRTLTPFTFQAEERTFWEAPETYIRMSPFVNANKINEPLLLIHGAADDNPGSFPIQSERLFQAMKGLGGTVRLVMLPHEAHGYREATVSSQDVAAATVLAVNAPGLTAGAVQVAGFFLRSEAGTTIVLEFQELRRCRVDTTVNFDIDLRVISRATPTPRLQ